MSKLKWHIILALTLMAVFSGIVSAVEELHVGSGYAYLTIESAVNAASDGDIIIVHAGNYNENVNVYKRLTLIGDCADAVTVTARNERDYVFDVTADYVNISGFTMTGATGDYRAGIRLDDADYCNISGNTAPYNYYGIWLDESSNSTLANNIVNSNGRDGIRLSSSSNSTLTNNTVNSNNDCGIYISYSSNNMLRNNTVSGNKYNFGVGGSGLSWYIQSIDTSNTVDKKPIYYWVDHEDEQIPDDAGFVGVVNSTNITVRDIVLMNNSNGVLFAYTENSRIENVTTSDNDYGIWLYESGNNMLDDNNASNNWCGIYLLSSSSNTLKINTANSNSYCGIRMTYSSNYNMLENNNYSNNYRGISLWDSSNNNIACNRVQNNIRIGVCLDGGSTNNIISYNNLIKNGNYNTMSGGWEWNFYNDQSNPVDAKYNYWGGGMDSSTIDASIYDDEEGEGKVEFYPFETDPLQCTHETSQFYVNENGWWRDGGMFNISSTPIQSAVDAAVNTAYSGDSIFVYNGSYTENVYVDKTLTLKGEGADVVTVTAKSSNDHVFEVTAEYVNITGFSVRGATDYGMAGIYLGNADYCSISKNNVYGNSHGIYLRYSSSNLLTNNTVNSNNNNGISLRDSSSNTLQNNNVNLNDNYGIWLCSSNSNIFTNNTASDGTRGIYIESSSDNQLAGNNGSIRLWYSSNNTLQNNTANSNNYCGIHLCYLSDCNILTDNIANSNDNYGIYLESSSDNQLTNNTANSNRRHGIYLRGDSSNNILQNNIVSSNNNYGICLEDSSNNTLKSNTANSNKGDSIYLSSSSYNTLHDNTADSNNGNGIHLDYSSTNTLQNNTANSNNCYGIYLCNADNNNITCNWVQNNTQRGFYLAGGSTGNTIKHNNLIENGNYNAASGGWEWQFYIDQYNPVETKHNYWGAGMNNSTIDASIYDNEEGGWGEVEFYPFETEPVPCAPTPEESHTFTTTDAMIALQIAAGSRPPDPRWDVSGDGSVTSLDALMILQAAGGCIESN